MMKILKLLVVLMLPLAFMASCGDEKSQPTYPSAGGQNGDETSTSAVDFRLITDGSSWGREVTIASNGKVPKKVIWTFGENHGFTELTEMSDNTVTTTRSGEWDINENENILSLIIFEEDGTETEEDYRVSILNREKMVVSQIIDSFECDPMTFTPIETPARPPASDDDNRPQGIDISDPIVTDITISSAVVKGTILGDNVTFQERGACYSTSHNNPTINDSKAVMSADFVNILLKDLYEGTVYYIRLYAIIDDRVYYGKTVSFETEGNRTYKIDLKCDRIADQSLRLQARVPNEVGKYGICYDTSPKPKVTDDFLEEQNRATSWIIKDLKPGTTYYIRAYHNEGTKITYFEDSEINVRTLGSGGTDIELSYTGEVAYNTQPYFGYYKDVTYTITHSNLPKGMNEVKMLIDNYPGLGREIITRYTEETSGTITIDPEKINRLWWGESDTSLIVCVKNYETGIWYFKGWICGGRNNPRFEVGEIAYEYESFDDDWWLLQ